MAADTVSKNLIMFEFFSEKVFELHLYYWVVSFGSMFMLVLLLDHQSTEKQGGKKNLVGFIGSSSLKIVFALLAKTITVKCEFL